MTKTVFSPSEVAHVWASQTQESGRAGATDGDGWRGGSSGRCPNGSAYFDGGALFSYGDHYLTGFIVEPRNGASGGLVFLNDDSNSVTTNRRRHEASHAVNHFSRVYRLPSMTELRQLFKGATGRDLYNPEQGRYGAPDSMTPAAFVVAYVRRNAARLRDLSIDCSDEPNAAAKALGDLYKVRPASLAKALRDGLADDAKAAKEEAARQLKTDVVMAKHEAESVDDESWRADIHPAPTVRFTWNGPEVDSFGLRRVQDQAKLARYQAKLAKAHLSKKAAATLAERAKELSARARTIKNDAIKQAEAWRDESFATWALDGTGTVERPNVYIFANDSEERAMIEADQAREWAARHAESFRAWQAGEEGAERPSLSNFEAGTVEHATIVADQARERDALGAAFLAWEADKTAARPLARLFLSGELRDEYPNAWTLLSEAEREEKEAEKREKQKAAWDLWEAGRGSCPSHGDANGRAYLRRSADGERLETSQGATVPWEHAVKAFRFIKLCRANGRGFQSNGRTIRVGHYQVDRIDADGNMTAGCHRFAWAEIEKLAKAQGVFDAAPSEEAVTASH